ncbi:MAG: hypothetical protein ACLUDU_07875 [Butyricimonas faecihominis]
MPRRGPTNQITIEVNFDTAHRPTKCWRLSKEIDDLVENGPHLRVRNAQRYFNKLYKTNISQFLLATLSDYYRYGLAIHDYENTMGNTIRYS